ncbi:MAG: hypothetical protein ACFCU4_11740 [Puniceicoccaceae bacterium]
MKTIHEFLNNHSDEKPKSNQRGEFSDWLDFYELDVRGDALQFTETRVLGIRGNENAECHEIPVVPGKYSVECMGVSFGGDRRVAALRAYPKGKAVTVGEKVSEIPVDLGGVSVVDIAAIIQSINENEERYEEWAEEILFGSDDYSLVSLHEWLETKTKIPSVESGFGDGVYDLFELRSDGGVVGLQIVFIREDDLYFA